MFTIGKNLRKWLVPTLATGVLSVIIFTGLAMLVFNQQQEILRNDLYRTEDTLQSLNAELTLAGMHLGEAPAEACTPNHLTTLRQEVFDSAYIADISQIAADQNICSATEGVTNRYRVDPTLELPSAIGMKAATLKVLTPSEFKDEDIGLAVQQGAALFTIDTRHLTPHARSGNHVTIVGKDEGGYFPLFGDLAGEGFSLISAERLAQPMLNETACLTDINLCVYAWRDEDRYLSPLPILGLISLAFGFLLGFGITFLVRRSHSKSTTLQHKLKRAIHDKQLFVLYQPIVDIKTGEVKSAEALVRWIDTDGEFISPAIFCALAEDAGFSDRITDFVLTYTAEHFWTLPENKDVKVSFNVAPIEILAPNFIERYTKLLAKHEIPTSQVKFEITERTHVDFTDLEQALTILADSGFGVSLDDFGTGHASFPYLRRLQLDTVKIDRSFVQAVGEDNAFSRIVPHLVDMIMALGVEVVVEGLEEQKQRDWFAARGDLYAQGYYFSRPLAPHNFAEYITDQEEMLAATQNEKLAAE